MPFICIYCRQSPPAVAPSEAHIFPYAIGGSESTDETVCAECNHRINQQVEMPALPRFRVFQNLHGIEGRRGGVPGVPATASVEGYEAQVILRERGLPSQAIVRIETDEHGRERYVVYAPTDEMLKAKFDEISRKHPGLQWTEGGSADVTVTARDFLDPSDPVLLRLAAKVAFERFAQVFTATVAATNTFDDVRNYILTGSEREPCSGVLVDERLLNGALNVPVPVHAVVLIAHPRDLLLGGFVVFFGLFHFWTILSRRYQAHGPFDDLMIQRPLTRETYVPVFRAKVGSIRVPWAEIMAPHLRDATHSARVAIQHARQKFKAATDDYYGACSR